MDSNGLRFWLLAEAAHFPALQHATWDAGCRLLRLASERTLQAVLPAGPAQAAAELALDQVPRAIDALECVARWDSGAVRVHSALPGDVPLLPLPAAPTDLCSTPDGVLCIAQADGILLHDLRARWPDTPVALAGFAPWRLAAAPDGTLWALERGSGRLAHLRGRPLRSPAPQPGDYDGRVFRPSPENGCAPQLALAGELAWPADEQALALACDSAGTPLLLSWRGIDGTACVRRLQLDTGRLGAPLIASGANFAYAIASLAPQRIALRVPGRQDAPAFDLSAADADGRLMPLGEVYPLAGDAIEAPFANGSIAPPHYPAGNAGAEPLHALSLNQLARRGEAANHAASPAGLVAHAIDSRDTTTVWHRLVAEAAIPDHCGFVVWLAATNELQAPPADDRVAWQPHGFGRDIASLDEALQAPHVPRAAWDRAPSELPHHPGLLGGEPEPDVRGLFSVLIQDSRRRVRSLVGRYLWVRIVLHGDGRTGPGIAALRAWGSRLSYVDRYLPRLYRESLFGDAAQAPGTPSGQIEAGFGAALDAAGAPDAALRERLALLPVTLGDAARITVERAGQAWLLRDGALAWRLVLEAGAIALYRPRATPSDFNARLLANFEGVLTQLEDRVASAHLLSDPDATGEDHLEWLGGWIGVAFDPALPSRARRDWLRAAPDLARWHGTRNGLRLALDVATGGGVRSGAIVVVEDFRLRRILATLLGVDLSDEHDPLLPGLGRSGNSIVGDTLFVGDQERVELLALFDASVGNNAEDAAALNFYERLANRATVLVHQQVEAQDLALIRRIAQLEAPAHVDVRVAVASWPLLVGVSSLVGVDTFLGPPRTPQPVRVQRSSLGNGDQTIGRAVLDPRLAGTALPPP
ncbi:MULTISPECIES: phage tail protein [unclassified Rhizobacter]|uniref:phage tail protein n=1 Tax=unclassified Rhizobacter TaxID=2640088 RepID=UPI0006F66286|nr:MULTISPECIES: phage tail protein [unclassified Rhizobacter]KQU77061.1 phage tail protein [Rhizobacter sp. Root29]KQW14225.1 phage tail protein [Rhizobacter sp. Root1238]KRB18591.1 phage tail protein [Rhizobacter sp. Root16D2]